MAPDEVKGAGSTVFKSGRTTGSTQGQLNTINSSVRMRYVFGGGHKIVEGKVLLVVSPPATSKLWLGGYSVPIAFGWHGDSGSLVFDHQGRVLGMYIGGQNQSCDFQGQPPVRLPQSTAFTLSRRSIQPSTPSELQRATIQRLAARTSISISFGAQLIWRSDFGGNGGHGGGKGHREGNERGCV